MIKLGYCAILPQTAMANFSDVDNCLQVHTRILFDSGSQGPTSLKQFETVRGGGLDFADDYEGNTTNPAIGVLIGIDFYHSLITGITL